QDCLYSLLYVPRERHEEALDRLVRPLLLEIRDHPAFESFFFVRFSEPRWQLRVRILGRGDWVNGPLRDIVERRIEEARSSLGIEAHEFQRYDREYERYGGERGMALAEKLFHLDSVAALELAHLDRAGAVRRSRREIAMLLADRVVDLAGFSTAERIDLYKYGYGWALEMKTWEQEDLDLLEQRFLKLREGLDRLM